MTEARVHDAAPCLLGEGALWHPERRELWWFDILGRLLHGPGARHRLPALASAMGWIDRDTVLMAREGGLVRFDLERGEEAEVVAPLEADNPVVRPNDGRADPWGGFWIGTMGIAAETGAGSIWRFYRGEVRRLVAPITIPNAICFHPDGTHACFADTDRQVVWRQGLAAADGWPVGEPEVHVDLRGTDERPDGAVMDAAGTIWIALWGRGEVAGYRDGRRVGEFTLPARQTSCPAIGDDGTLYVVSAAVAIPQEEVARNPGQGRTFAVDAGLRGVPEPRVIL